MRLSLVLLALGGCTEELLPGELVLGVDWPAEVSFGGEGDRYGASVAWNGEPLVAAPGGGYLLAAGERMERSARWVGAAGDAWVYEGDGYQAGGSTLWLGSEPGGELSGLVPNERAVGIGSDRAWIAHGNAVRWVSFDAIEGPKFKIGQVVAVAGDTSRTIILSCPGDCEVLAFDPEGRSALPSPALPDGTPLRGGEGGAVAILDGVVCVGDPMLDDDDGRGRVTCEDGTVVEGEPGDQLGQAIAAGYTVGTFNKWVVPARARVVPLWEGDIYAIEHGAESQPMTLAGDDSTLVIGAPYESHDGATSGAAYVVTR